MEDVRPRLVWGRRPRPNGGRRRPRGRIGYWKYAPVVSRGSNPQPKPRPTPPSVEQFPLIAIDLQAATGNPEMDEDMGHIALLCGGMARIRKVILARANIQMTFGVHLAETCQLWRDHDKLLNLAEVMLQKVEKDYGVKAPTVPTRFYHKF